MNIFKQTINIFWFSALLLVLNSCKHTNSTPVKPAIIPAPLSQTITDGVFFLDSNTSLTFDEELKDVALFFKDYIETNSKVQFSTTNTDQQLSFIKDATILNPEGYQLDITNSKITISASSSKGAFYAVQSLRQLLPSDFESVSVQYTHIKIQCITIKDEPKFTYRGMHLDVGRHFFSVDFIKKYIDLISRLKMNTFHWHLTEDQGWRIEIKKYPKLNTVAAYRNETLVGHYRDQPHQFDGKKYGGFYTQEEIKDIVKYATARQITVIPEIEMPGHSQAAISAYPELGCTGEQVDVATKWGVFEEIYCPKESTFKFLEDVIDEVVDLFPGKYIHIGGDEAPKKRWKKCDHCQQLIKKEGLKDEHGLQSYFITRMEKYINSKGKQIIGWDEILEGGLAPNATVMSWRGTKGAIEAAKEHHNVILTPGSHCYFDHYQSTNKNEPLAIGGYLPLEKVYSFNPIPKELNKEEANYVLGAQGNVWTEYMTTQEKVEYMAFPRVVALSEVVWSAPENKSYDDFKNRLVEYQKRLDVLNVNYANHLDEVEGNLEIKNGVLNYSLRTASNNKNIRFTVDGSTPKHDSKLYDKPIEITKNSTINAVAFKGTIQLGGVFSESFKSHKAVGKSISLSVDPSQSYNAGGKEALINSINGSDTRYGDKEWLGFTGDDIVITIDFENETEISSFSTRFFNTKGAWIHAPKKVVISFDNNEKPIEILIPPSPIKIIDISSKFKTKTVRKMTIKFYKTGIIPDGFPGAGHEAWTFIDELIIN